MEKISLAAAAFLCAFSGQAFAQEPITMKVTVIGTLNNPVNACGSYGLAKDFAEKSGGRIKLEPYAGGTAFANPTKFYEQVERGIIDYTMAIVSYSPGRFPLTELIGLPMLTKDNVEMARAATELAPEYLADELSGVHLLAVPAVGAYQFHLRKPVEKFEDLNGRRIAASGRIVEDALSEFGIQATQLPATEVYENMQKGVLDGSLLPWASVLAFKMDEVVDQHYAIDFVTPPALLIMSKKFYASLPDDLKNLVDEEMSGPEVAARISKCWVDLAEKAKKKTLASGNSIAVPTDDERAAIAARLRPVSEKIVGELEDDGKNARAFYEALKKRLSRTDD